MHPFKGTRLFGGGHGSDAGHLAVYAGGFGHFLEAHNICMYNTV